MAVVAIRRAEFTSGDWKLVAVEVSDRKVEIYWVDPADGMEMFQGYVSDTCIPASIRMRVIEELVKAPYFDNWIDYRAGRGILRAAGITTEVR